MIVREAEDSVERFERQIRFILEIDKLKNIVRRTYLLNADRAENTAEHSWHLAIMMVAAGTTPNITYEKEHPASFQMDSKKKFFAPHRLVRNGGGFKVEPDSAGVFTSYNKDGRFISFYGDNHPLYAGNVVKAMASARDGYPHVATLFQDELATLDPDRQDERDLAWKSLCAQLDSEFVARVSEVRRLTPTIVEVIVHAGV